MNTNSEKAFDERHSSNGSSSLSLLCYSMESHGVLMQWRSFRRKRFWRYLCHGFGGNLPALRVTPSYSEDESFAIQAYIVASYIVDGIWRAREEKVIEEHFNKHLVSARVASTTCRICEACGTKKKTLSSHEESNLRPLDSALPCSATEPQGPFGERGSLRSSWHASYILLVDHVFVQNRPSSWCSQKIIFVFG